MPLWGRLTRRWSPDTTPRFEPVDPPSDVLAAMSAPPPVCDANGDDIPSKPLAGYHAQDVAHERAVLDDLSARIAGGMSPLMAAQARFGEAP